MAPSLDQDQICDSGALWVRQVSRNTIVLKVEEVELSGAFGDLCFFSVVLFPVLYSKDAQSWT